MVPEKKRRDFYFGMGKAALHPNRIVLHRTKRSADPGLSAPKTKSQDLMGTKVSFVSS